MSERDFPGPAADRFRDVMYEVRKSAQRLWDIGFQSPSSSSARTEMYEELKELLDETTKAAKAAVKEAET